MAEILGDVADGFDLVRTVFEHSRPDQGGAAFSAYVDGRKVVDLWSGSARAGEAWREDTISTAMSASKGLAALCAQILWDRGELDLDAPVTRYWPEFGAAGKSGTLVRHVLTHTSGMLCFQDPGSLLDWDGNGWDDYDEIARRIAASPPAWEPGSQIGYHAISVGWLIQELVRRITGDTVGAFFAREVADPLSLDAHIGTPSVEHARIADLLPAAPVAGGFARRVMSAFAREVARPGSPMGQAGVYMHGGTFSSHLTFFNTPGARRSEIPAANATSDARSLARVYAMLADGGELDGHRIVSPESIELFRTPSRSGRTSVWPQKGWPRLLPAPEMRYAMGFEGDFGEGKQPWRFGPTHESFGHLGAGGQLGFADPKRRVAVGFIRSHLTDWTVSTALVSALYESLDA
ncbi:CubicO group peptidase (beta-lactamase class C family) [Microbacterium sp. ZKA21]|uniref:serine hydrolase domain-containing protein n=1 Tax=Microbacterium sp. ZKA21 TaxID=3381694 RepID=UPI003D1B49C1